AEEILLFGILDDERSEPVPQIVERVQTLRIARALVTRLHERPPQLDGMGQYLPAEPVAETEIMFRGKVPGIFGIGDDVPVTSQNFACHGVPYEQLRIAVRREVLLVYVRTVPRPAPRLAESQLAQTADFPHDIRRVAGLHRIDEIARIVGRAQQALRSELLLYEFPRYGLYYRFHILFVSLRLKMRQAASEHRPATGRTASGTGNFNPFSAHRRPAGHNRPPDGACAPPAAMRKVSAHRLSFRNRCPPDGTSRPRDTASQCLLRYPATCVCWQGGKRNRTVARRNIPARHPCRMQPPSSRNSVSIPGRAPHPAGGANRGPRERSQSAGRMRRHR